MFHIKLIFRKLSRKNCFQLLFFQDAGVSEQGILESFSTLFRALSSFSLYLIFLLQLLIFPILQSNTANKGQSNQRRKTGPVTYHIANF